MKEINGGVTAAKGFQASAAAAGIKYQDRNDMALVYTKEPAVCAGTFTTNVVKAAPVVWDKELVDSKQKVNAVVLNSGIANACTGKEGVELNLAMAEAVANQFGIQAENVLTASTGVIGMQLPKEPLQKGAILLKEALDDSEEAGLLAAKAIMTTDTVPKQFAASLDVNGTTVTIGGMSKGSGMIHPNMATMLSVITTDAVIDQGVLQKMVSECVQDSFNMISVDRDTSTNDTCVVLANGLAGNATIEMGSKAANDFQEALFYIMKSLAMKMAGDGEGATKLLEVTVIHAATKKKAAAISKSVINSPLVKTALFGSDANWGRILCAMGYSGEEFDPEKVDITIMVGGESLEIVKNCVATGYSEEKASELLGNEKVTFLCDLKEGDATATAWGCDLTYDYVKINGDYRS